MPRAKKKKENAPESDRASWCFVKTEWEKLPGDATTRSFFFSSVLTDSERAVN